MASKVKTKAQLEAEALEWKSKYEKLEESVKTTALEWYGGSSFEKIKFLDTVGIIVNPVRYRMTVELEIPVDSEYVAEDIPYEVLAAIESYCPFDAVEVSAAEKIDD